MAAPDDGWNAAAVCAAIGCRGCFDCRDDDHDIDWDGKDAGDFYACQTPECDTPRDHDGDCPDCDTRLHHIGPDGMEVTP